MLLDPEFQKKKHEDPRNPGQKGGSLPKSGIPVIGKDGKMTVLDVESLIKEKTQSKQEKEDAERTVHIPGLLSKEEELERSQNGFKNPLGPVRPISFIQLESIRTQAKVKGNDETEEGEAPFHPEEEEPKDKTGPLGKPGKMRENYLNTRQAVRKSLKNKVRTEKEDKSKAQDKNTEKSRAKRVAKDKVEGQRKSLKNKGADKTKKDSKSKKKEKAKLVNFGAVDAGSEAQYLAEAGIEKLGSNINLAFEHNLAKWVANLLRSESVGEQGLEGAADISFEKPINQWEHEIESRYGRSQRNDNPTKTLIQSNPTKNSEQSLDEREAAISKKEKMVDHQEREHSLNKREEEIRRREEMVDTKLRGMAKKLESIDKKHAEELLNPGPRGGDEEEMQPKVPSKNNKYAPKIVGQGIGKKYSPDIIADAGIAEGKEKEKTNLKNKENEPVKKEENTNQENHQESQSDSKGSKTSNLKRVAKPEPTDPEHLAESISEKKAEAHGRNDANNERVREPVNHQKPQKAKKKSQESFSNQDNSNSNQQQESQSSNNNQNSNSNQQNSNSNQESNQEQSSNQNSNEQQSNSNNQQQNSNSNANQDQQQSSNIQQSSNDNQQHSSNNNQQSNQQQSFNNQQNSGNNNHNNQQPSNNQNDPDRPSAHHVLSDAWKWLSNSISSSVSNALQGSNNGNNARSHNADHHHHHDHTHDDSHNGQISDNRNSNNKGLEKHSSNMYPSSSNEQHNRNSDLGESQQSRRDRDLGENVDSKQQDSKQQQLSSLSYRETAQVKSETADTVPSSVAEQEEADHHAHHILEAAVNGDVPKPKINPDLSEIVGDSDIPKSFPGSNNNPKKSNQQLSLISFIQLENHRHREKHGQHPAEVKQKESGISVKIQQDDPQRPIIRHNGKEYDEPHTHIQVKVGEAGSWDGKSDLSKRAIGAASLNHPEASHQENKMERWAHDEPEITETRQAITRLDAGKPQNHHDASYSYGDGVGSPQWPAPGSLNAGNAPEIPGVNAGGPTNEEPAPDHKKTAGNLNMRQKKSGKGFPPPPPPGWGTGQGAPVASYPSAGGQAWMPPPPPG